MSSLKISQITTCRAHVQLAPWLLKFRSCPDESDIFETAVQSGFSVHTHLGKKSRFKNVRIRSARGLHFRKKLIIVPISITKHIAPISITKLILRRYQYRFLFYDVLFQNNDSKICHIYRSYEERRENYLQRRMVFTKKYMRFKS